MDRVERFFMIMTVVGIIGALIGIAWMMTV
jgi:hypothetical protein